MEDRLSRASGTIAAAMGLPLVGIDGLSQSYALPAGGIGLAFGVLGHLLGDDQGTRPHGGWRRPLRTPAWVDPASLNGIFTLFASPLTHLLPTPYEERVSRDRGAPHKAVALRNFEGVRLC